MSELFPRALRQRSVRVGAGLLALVVLPALLAPLLPLPDPDGTRLAERLRPPLSDGAVLGTDSLGRDLLSRLLHGTRTSLAVAALGTGVAALVGALLGLVAAYYRRWVDAGVMRVIDVLMAFPYLLLALTVVAVLGPGLSNATLAIAIVNVPFFARAVRGAALPVREQDFMQAARLSGLSEVRILLFELLPNVAPYLLVTLASTLGWMILETAGLSFLGLGAQPPTADLGSMLGQGRVLLVTAPHVSLLPGAVIFLLVLGINLVGDGLRDALDPRARDDAGAPLPSRLPAPGALPDETVLSVQSLRTGFSSRDGVALAVRDVSFELRRGETLALVGESGSGKSLTALSLLGLVDPPGGVVSGSIRLLGEELTSASSARLQGLRGRTVGYVPQDPLSSLDPLFTVEGQLLEVLGQGQVRGAAARARAAELLHAVHIPDVSRVLAAYPHELSGGMRQRVAIALAIAHRPAVLIADEPTTALDVTTQAELVSLFQALCQEREMALLFISHDFAVVSQLCQRVAVMYAGELVETGLTQQVLSSPRHPYTRRLLECAPRLGARVERLRPIPGAPPELGKLPEGCAFGPRCEEADARCRSAVSLRRADGREVRCVRAPAREEGT